METNGNSSRLSLNNCLSEGFHKYGKAVANRLTFRFQLWLHDLMHRRIAPLLAALAMLWLVHPAFCDDLMQQLLKAQSESDVDALLTSHPGEFNTELGNAILLESDKSRDQSDYPKALLLAQISEKIASRLKDNAAVVDSWNRISALYGNMLKPELSLQYARQSLKLSRDLKYPRGTARALLRMGDLQDDQGKTADAMDSLHEALSLYQELNDQEGMGRCFNNLGGISSRAGKNEEALKNYEEALTLRRQVGDQRQIGGTLNNMATVYRRQGFYDQAIEYYSRSLEAFNAVGDRKLMAMTTFNIGNIYKARGNLRASLENYEKALRTYEELGIEEGMSYMLFGIGTTYRALGNYDEALRYHERGLALGERAGNQREISDAYCHIGAVYSEQGNYSLAANYTKKCADVRQSSNLRENLPDTLGDLGVIYLRQGNEDLAMKYFQDGLTLAREQKQSEDVPNLLNKRGYANFLSGNFQQAADDYHGALDQARALKNRSIVADTLENLGYLYLAKGDLAEASASLEESLSISEEMNTMKNTADVLHGLAEVYYAKDDYKNAADFSRRSADLAENIHSADTHWKALTTLGRAQMALELPDQARQSLERAIAVIDDLRLQVSGSEEERQRFFEDKLVPYDSLVLLLCSQQKFEEALAYAERGKGRVLDDLLQQGKIEISGAITAAEREQEQKWIAEMISLNTQLRAESTRQKPDSNLIHDLNQKLEDVRSGYAAFRTGLYDEHPQLKRQAVSETPTMASFQALVYPQNVFFEYVVSDARTLMFVMNKAKDGAIDLKVHPIEIRRSDLTDQIQKFRLELNNRDPGFALHAQSLYKLLLGPAEAEMHGRTGIVIVPDRDLWALPFQALIDTKGSYVMNRFATSYASSLTVLRDLQAMRRQESDSGHQLLAFGNPTIASSASDSVKVSYRSRDLVSLPEAERETKILQKLYGKDSAIIYTGEGATESRWKQESERYRILHLATHGILNSSSPLYSYLVLAHPASETNEDGLLEAWEILHSHLSADLVVLSACETALGRVGAGEGIIGLSWAFFAAGSRATIVSQWKVDSESTAQLMLLFYKNLRKGVAKNEALRLAAISLSKNERYRHPFYWAGFVLIGDEQ